MIATLHRCLGLLLLSVALVGCGGYADTSQAFRNSLTHGQPEEALVAVNEALGVPDAQSLPKQSTADTPLLLLERGTILQALKRYDLSARDYQLADKDLIVLDITNDTAGEIAKYLFSDDATVYKAPPHEKLLLNTLNLINYLARGDSQGAKIEARRILISRKFLEGTTDEKRLSMMALASYLAGFAFEAAGEPEAAMRHYGDALDAGGIATLEGAVRRLAARTGASDPRLKSWTEGEPAQLNPDDGEVVVVIQTGMSPYKRAERMPIGAAIVAASDPGPGARLSREDQRRAQAFALKGVLKWVNYPSLQAHRSSRPGPTRVEIGGQGADAGVGLDITNAVVHEFKRHEGALIAGALTRLLTRAVAGQLSQAVAKNASNNGLAGLLVGLAVEGAMTAADTPDTRGWVTLPGRIDVARLRLPPGRHPVTVQHQGRRHTGEVELAPGGFAVINFSAWR